MKLPALKHFFWGARGDLGHFSSQYFPLKMRRKGNSDAIVLYQEFNVDFENLTGFQLAPEGY